jgi:hypothetical protein
MSESEQAAATDPFRDDWTQQDECEQYYQEKQCRCSMCEQAADLDEQEIKELVLSHYYKKNSQVGQDLEELLQSQYQKSKPAVSCLSRLQLQLQLLFEMIGPKMTNE